MKTRRHRFACTRIIFAACVTTMIVCSGGSALGANTNLLQNTSLESAAGDTPNCWLLGGYGTNNFTWSHTSDAHSGSYAEKLDVTSLTNGDRKLLSAFDSNCSPGTTQGHTYTVSVWYKSADASQPVIFAFTRSASTEGYTWWAQSPRLPSSASWTHASWTTPAMPSGITNLSVGLGLQTAGTVTIDDLSLIDNNEGSPAPPSVSTSTTPPAPTAPPATTTTATTTTTAAPPPPPPATTTTATTTTTAAPPPPPPPPATTTTATTTTTAAPKPPTTTTTPTTTTVTTAAAVVPNNLLQNASLETGSSATPDCWLLGGYGTNTYNWVRTTASPHSGQYAEQLDVTGYSNGDRKLLSAFNGSCSPATTQGHAYTVTVWYKSSAQPAIFAFTRNASTGRYGWWAQSPRLPSSSSWTAVTWTTPAVPAGVTNVSVGLGLQMAGSVTIDDLSLTDNAGGGAVPDTTLPSVSLTTPTSGTTLTGPVTLSANAADNVAVDHVEFLVDGTKIGSVSSAPYQLSLDSTSLSQGTHTISARAVDSSGNAKTSAAVSVTVYNPPPPTPPPADTTPPSVSLTAPSAGATLAGTVTLTANASDNVAVATVGFLIDGVQIGSTTASPYGLSLDSTSLSNGAHTISARAVDSSGNAKTSAGVAVTVANVVAPPPPPPSGYFSTLPSGAPGLPVADSTCAAQVTTNPWEPRSDNQTANHTVPSNPALVPWSTGDGYWAKWMAKRDLVTGNYTGTTNQIIQWAACKWGLDEDLLRAVAVQESSWHMSSVGDYCGVAGEASYGLFQIKNAYCNGAVAFGGYPVTAEDTALNADFYGAHFRSCLDNDFYDGGSWLYNGQTIAQITAAKGFDYVVWGCVGYHFSGGWYDSGAVSYINSVKSHLANKDWLKY
jgi:archaellum component FlaF (FlaF/FlaG flagellin family)